MIEQKKKERLQLLVYSKMNSQVTGQAVEQIFWSQTVPMCFSFPSLCVYVGAHLEAIFSC